MTALAARGDKDVAKAAGASLVFDDISHDYDGIASVRNVSLELQPGEVLCLLGHSGCGKTTLLRIAAGIERQASGRVLVDGAEVAGPATYLPPERRGVGLMFQDYALFPHLTIMENVVFGLAGLPRAKAFAEGLAALERVGLVGYADDYPHALSGGEQQRVALARAMAPRPGVLLMDEPFSGLDRRLRDTVRASTLSVLSASDASCIIVTHDPEEAMMMGDRIALMRAGRIVQLGTARDLYTRPHDLFVARFFSDLDEIDSRVAGGTVETPVGSFAAGDLAEGTEVTVCVRPQDVRLARTSKDGGKDRGVAGKIVEKRFLGEVDLYHVAIEGLPFPLRARLRGTDFVPGDDVTIEVVSNGVYLFPLEPGHRST